MPRGADTKKRATTRSNVCFAAVLCPYAEPLVHRAREAQADGRPPGAWSSKSLLGRR